MRSVAAAEICPKAGVHVTVDDEPRHVLGLPYDLNELAGVAHASARVGAVVGPGVAVDERVVCGEDDELVSG